VPGSSRRISIPWLIAVQYEEAGAHAISVLTDEEYFQGHLTYLTKVRAAVDLPCLRKDFILHDAQIYEACVAGADAILLIVAALEQPATRGAFLKRPKSASSMCSWKCTPARNSTGRSSSAPTLVGINNRNLTTFEVDLTTTEELSEEGIPEGIILVR